jgi:hypothetical protein
VTDEAVDVVDKWVASKKKTGYPILIDRGGLEQSLGVPHFPYSGVIDPDGNLVYAGDAPESAIKKGMKSAKPGSMWPKKLASAAAQLRNGKLAEAWAELQTLKSAGGLDEKEQSTLDKFSTYISDASTASVKTAEELFKKDMVYAAFKKAEGIANAKPALPATEDAAKLLTEIKAVVGFDNEMKGGEFYAAAFAKEESADYLGAVGGYKDVMKKAEGTKIAEVAKKRAEDLIKRGMPGFEPVCEKCSKAKKACEKHAKAVKL